MINNNKNKKKGWQGLVFRFGLITASSALIRRIVILTMIAAFMLAACNRSSPSDATPEPSPTVASPTPTSTPPIATPALGPLLPVPIEQVQGVTWQWFGWIETSPASQSLVPQPQYYTLSFQPDGSIQVRADCNQISGAYTAREGNLSLVFGPTTLAACPPDSLHDPFLEMLGNVDSYGLRDVTLVLQLRDAAGELLFTSAGDFSGGPPGGGCNAGIDPGAVTLDTQELPYSYQPNCISATTYDASMPPGPVGLPDHIRVDFGSLETGAMQFIDPVLYIIPVSAYEQLWTQAGDPSLSDSLDSLRMILQDKPNPAPGQVFPVLPNEQVMGAADIQVQTQYLQFQQGSGVRFVSRFTSDPAPLARDNPALFYTFQGLSKDGEYVISFFYPLTTEALPSSAEITPAERQQVETAPNLYLAEKTIELDALTGDDWSPKLSVLDAVVHSLDWGASAVSPPVAGGGTPAVQTPQPTPVEPPPLKELVNVHWVLVRVVEKLPPGQLVIDAPGKYALALFRDGRVFYQADCNVGGGTYVMRGAQINIDITSSSRKYCGVGSLDSTFRSFLTWAKTIALEGGRLVIDGDARMVFENNGPASAPNEMPTVTPSP